jgi:hypothetical protein
VILTTTSLKKSRPFLGYASPNAGWFSLQNDLQWFKNVSEYIKPFTQVPFPTRVVLPRKEWIFFSAVVGVSATLSHRMSELALSVPALSVLAGLLYIVSVCCYVGWCTTSESQTRRAAVRSRTKAGQRAAGSFKFGPEVKYSITVELSIRKKSSDKNRNPKQG